MDSCTPGKVFLINRQTGMNITLVYESTEYQNATAMLLDDAGFTVNQALPLYSPWLQTSKMQPPDILVISVTRPDQDLLQQLSILKQSALCPVIVLSPDAKADITRETILAGADTCITGKISADRIQSFIEVACIRFEMTRNLYNEINELKEQIESLENQLSDRRDIDRAKGLLMKSYKMTEEAAYSALRHMAMDSGNKLGEVARNLISMSKLLN